MNSKELSAETAKTQFAETIDFLKRIIEEKLKTRTGRDDIRRTFGCRIEGFEDEEKEGIPGGLFDSPML